MADTSLLFNIIARDGGVGRTLTDVAGKFRSAGRDAEDSLARTSSSTDRAGNAASTFGNILSSVGSGAISLGTNVTNLAFALSAVAAGSLAAGGAIGVFGGAAAALPGMLSGAIAAIATLKLGLFGLGENWKAMNTAAGGGGGGAAKTVQDMTPKLRAVEAAQRQVARSARDVTDAQLALRDATAEVNEAREEEQERIEDVRRSLASARADEAASVQSLAEARMQLALAEQRGNPDEIRRAQIAVDKQAASLEEAKDKTEDLQKEADEAAAKGVEGSDAVVSAKKREQDAQRRVTDAVEQHKLALQQLGDAQKALRDKLDQPAGGGGGLSQEIPRISKSAQEFLNVLKSLKPAFEDLRLEVQERLFAGLGDKLRTLANVWIPQLRISLGNMADTINGVVKTAFDSLSDPDFVRNMAAGFEGFRGMLGQIGQAVAGPLVDAWGRLSAASLPFMDMLGEKIAGIITRFSEWIARIDESGQLGTFMQDAATIAGHVLDIMEDLARIAGSVMSILFGTESGNTDNWEALAEQVDQLANWLADPEIQANFADFINGFLALGYGAIWLATQIDNLIQWIGGLGGSIGGFVSTAGAWLSALPGLVGGWLSAAAEQMGAWISYGVRTALAWLGSLPSAAGNVLRSLGNTVANAARNVGSYLYNALANLPNMVYSIGYNIVVGLWNGIQSRASWLWDAAYNLAASIWRNMQAALGIRSPSAVMADSVGKWIPLGIAEGIDANAGAVTAAASRIAAGLAGTSMSVGGLDMGQLDQAVLAATGTVQVAASRRRPVEVVTVLDVRGADSQMKTMIRKMARTDNLYQTKG